MKIDTTTDPIEVGDYVTIADSAGPLTWEVLEIGAAGEYETPLVTLLSGNSSRRFYASLDRLTLHTKGQK